MYNRKIKKILIGTNNPGKLKEIKDLLPKSLNIFSTNNFKIKSPKENGRSFEENSFLKAKFFSKKSKMICLADDSGLEIDILNGAPGIYSSRWGGKDKNFNKAINRVFNEIKKKDKYWKNKKIKARFVCALTIYWPSKKSIKCIGKIEGYIANKKRGTNGFGYDPIFIPLNKKNTFAEMRSKEKYRIDHRFNAFKKIKKFF